MIQDISLPKSEGTTLADKSHQKQLALPRPEYPRPDFQRDTSSWLNLNGIWEFTFDEAMQGLYENWQHLDHFDRLITVPFAIQSKLSSIEHDEFCDYLWYGRNFTLPEGFTENKRILLHFGAVDYACKVWINGQIVGEHQGGHVPFSFDVTEFLSNEKPDRVVVFVEDTPSKLQPRGKQYWKPQNEGCFYTRTSGIWQTVWLEAVPLVYMKYTQIKSDIDAETVLIICDVTNTSRSSTVEGTYQLHAAITIAGALVWQGYLLCKQKDEPGSDSTFQECIALPNPRLWSPETPHLYDLHLTLCCNDQPLDQVYCYFGMRKISTKNGQVLLNNQPYYLRLVLDQGYFPDGLLTAPTDEALRHDIELIKEFGFNGVRKHQKIEDPRWLYWSDRLGVLVWGEMPSCYEWNTQAEQAFIEEWIQAIRRDYNHPSIIAWVPFNESWGIAQLVENLEQQLFCKKVVALTRMLDNTRLVIDNDGWQHLDDTSDLLTIHDYRAEGPKFVELYEHFKSSRCATDLPTAGGQPIVLQGVTYRGEPVIFSEFGGVSLIAPNEVLQAKLEGDWGYSNAIDSGQLSKKYRAFIDAFNQLGFVSGFCYTQLTDVEQEVNGLLTYDRRPKVDPASLAYMNQLAQLA